jgi:hypothetical protein
MVRDVQRKALRTDLAACTSALADAGAEADAAHANDSYPMDEVHSR